MRLGVFGGTFDPVHLGHLLLAETARAECQLDEVWFIPAMIPPQKQNRQISAAKARLEMLQLAIAGHASFRVSDLEIQRGGPSYTVDTLREISANQPDSELFLLIGADSLADFVTWREPAEILKLASLLAVNRGPIQPLPDLLLAELGPECGERIQLISMPSVAISATEIRERVAAGKTIRYQIPRSVEIYIQEHRLYCI